MTLATDLATLSQTTIQQAISNLSTYYYNGVFYQENMGNWPRMTLAPAAAMATAIKYSTSSTLSATYLQTIKQIVARVIDTNMTTSGLVLDGTAASGPFSTQYFQGPDRQSMGTAFGDIGAIEGMSNLAWILLHLPTGLIDSETYATWLNLCKVNCDYLDTVSHDTIYYINGNINAQLLGTYWLTSQACITDADKLKYQDMYERALAFLVNPSATSGVWSGGWGLTITVTGSEYDWSDYECYLSETSTRDMALNHFDWNYSHTQLDALARVFIMNRDTRLIRLINAIGNKIAPRFDLVNGYFDGTGGSRQNNHAPLNMAWPIVQSLLGVKSSNRTLISDTNLTTMFNFGKNDIINTNATNGLYSSAFMHGLSLSTATIREACALSQVKVSAT